MGPLYRALQMHWVIWLDPESEMFVFVSHRKEMKRVVSHMSILKRKQSHMRTTRYRALKLKLMGLMEIYKRSNRVGCECTIYSRERIEAMWASGEASNQQVLQGVTQVCVCENAKTQRSMRMFNKGMGLVGNKVFC